jgi:FlaA1/EpsC-like NDP-sugar epimerase
MHKVNYYIIGAGQAGRALVRELRHLHPHLNVIFIDDNEKKIGQSSEGFPIIGSITTQLPHLNPSFAVIIAIVNLPKPQLYQLHNALKNHGFTSIALLPALSQLLAPQGSLALTRDIDPCDFLGREPILLNLEPHLHYLKGKRILVTGAGGSIGSELARQLLNAQADRLYLLGHGENSIYQIEKELRLLQQAGIGVNATIVPVIGELQDADFIKFIIMRLQPNIIFHCAAHKHVPLMEANPVEVIKNNVFGLYNLLEAAKMATVAHLVLISTDKAVDPNNTYGASKALCEEMVLAAHKAGHPFFIVRFGNVLGSRGSIIPLFKEQIAHGGPLTITDKRMTRYFMTIPEATSLVLMAGSVGSKTGLYLLDMGKPIKIIDLAAQIACFYGYDLTKGDLEVKYIGLREGETLGETLFSTDESLHTTEYPLLIEIIKKPSHKFLDMPSVLTKLMPICYRKDGQEALFRNRRELKRILQSCYPHFKVPVNEPEY